MSEGELHEAGSSQRSGLARFSRRVLVPCSTIPVFVTSDDVRRSWFHHWTLLHSLLKKLLIALVCLIPGGLQAEEAEPRFLFGLAGDVIAPTGESLKAAYNTGFGVTMRGHYELSRNLGVILTASYVSFPADAPEGVTVDDGSMIPVVAGFKFFLPAGDIRFFAAVDAGLTSVDRWVLSSGGASTSTSSTEFTWQPHLGLETKLGNNSFVEISSRYIAIPENEGVGIRIGILFGI
jgi:hypothetical protein